MAFLAYYNDEDKLTHYPCGGKVKYITLSDGWTAAHFKCEKCGEIALHCAQLTREQCAVLTDYRYEPKPKPNRAERRKTNKEKPNATN